MFYLQACFVNNSLFRRKQNKKNKKILEQSFLRDVAFLASESRLFQSLAPLNENVFCPLLVFFFGSLKAVSVLLSCQAAGNLRIFMNISLRYWEQDYVVKKSIS